MKAALQVGRFLISALEQDGRFADSGGGASGIGIESMLRLFRWGLLLGPFDSGGVCLRGPPFGIWYISGI